MKRRILSLLIPLAMLFSATACTPSIMMTILDTAQENTCTGGLTGSLTVDPDNLPTIDGYTTRQLSAAAQILKVGADLGMPERAQLIALMTAMQESTLGEGKGVLEPNSDHDAGYFQQRTLPGWYGTLDQVNDPAYGARVFFLGKDVEETVPGGAGNKGYHIPGLKDIQGWEQMSLTQAASAVQRPAKRYEGEYAKHEAAARALMAALAGVPVTEASGSLVSPTLGCDTSGLPTAINVDGLPTQAQLSAPSAQYACPEGTVDLGTTSGGLNGARIPIRLCSIPGTVCTGADCRKGELNGKARGEVVVNSLVAPYFVNWLNEVRAQGKTPTFNSSFRSWSTQSRLWRGGANGNAARPGWSNHQMGSAIDISGLPGSYNRNNCSGHAADGSCQANGDTWSIYHTAGLNNGAVFHDQEFWHLEWIITRANQRNIPFIP